MNRRTVLIGAGLSLSASSAGCLSNSNLSGDTDNKDEPDDLDIPDSPSDYPVTTGDLEEFDPERTYKEVNIGSRDGVDDAYNPHDVEVWNEAAESEVALRIMDYIGDSVVHHETYEIPDGTSLSVSLLQPSDYFVEVSVPATDTQYILRVPCRFFDCNVSVTQIGVFEDGKMRSSALSTRAACPSPEC